MFGDVRFVLMCGSSQRAQTIATRILEETDLSLPLVCFVSQSFIFGFQGTNLVPVGKTERYVMYKIGPVLTISHGIGMPSLSVMLHEITKLLEHAKVPKSELVSLCVCSSAHALFSVQTYIRVGTCGGLGVEPGTTVISSRSVNGLLRPEFNISILGNVQTRNTEFVCVFSCRFH